MDRRGGTRLVAVLAGAALVAGTAACGGDDGSTGAGGKIKLSIATFSDFGYADQIKEFQAANPNIEVVTRVTEFDPHHKQLATRLAAGAGAADIEAVEEGYLPSFRQSKDRFTNLAEFGAADLKSQWLPWKWEQGVTDGGSTVLGLGTDMGGLAMCYRRDLFEKAGLPTDRAEVSALWPTWDAYFATGRRFVAKGGKAAWFDGVGNVYSARVNQQPFGYFAPQGDTYAAGTNAPVKEAFLSSAAAAREKGMSAKLDPFSQQWNVGFKQGTFATVPCPSWMLGLIKDAVGEDGRNTWDIASVPGGGGNWGGSFLTVPKQSKHPKEAYELAKFLTAPDSQKHVFETVGSLPSQPALLKDPAVLGFTNEWFNGAPTGEIFAKSGESLQPNYRGAKDSEVRLIFGRQLGQAEKGKANPQQAWDDADAEARKVLRLG